MLSFMREQGIGAAQQGNDPAARPTELPGTLSASASEQYLTVAHKKRARKSNYLLIILFCAGLLILWLMIKKSTPQSAAAAIGADTQIETLLSKIAGVRSEMFSNLDEIAEKFYKFADVQQVEGLVRNPFRAELVSGNLGQTVGGKSSNYGSYAEASKQSEPERNTNHMQLLSIMTSSERNCCMINDRILYEGDSIKGFKVLKIGENFVKLEQETADDPSGNKGDARTEIVLKLSE
jgi:hypothetical protein